MAKYAKKCRPVGVELPFDPFYNSIEQGPSDPFFTECLGRFGIPFATTEASVAFLDARQEKYFDHETLLHYLSKGVFLDGEAAKLLCERGYGKYLGVTVGEDVRMRLPSLVYDLGALEVIRDGYKAEGEGKEMWCAHAYCPNGNGSWMQITLTDPRTEVITEGIDFRGKPIAPTMTYFENELGGRICVMSLTVKNNPSQALYNYRRQAVMQRMVCKMSDEFPMVMGAPDIYAIALAPRDKDSDLIGMLTLINLCEDGAEGVRVYLPPQLRGASALATIARDGSVCPLNAEKTEDGFLLTESLEHCAPTYILLKK